MYYTYCLLSMELVWGSLHLGMCILCIQLLELNCLTSVHSIHGFPTSMEGSVKFGNYDWVVDFDVIQTSLIETLIALEPIQQQEYVFRTSLIVGCGTSQVSQMLTSRGLVHESAKTKIHFERVISVDILEDCIRHMTAQQAASSNKGSLTWLQCDMLNTHQISDLIQSNQMPAYYDFIFDKGTFDAILVEGVVRQYVINVYNLLLPSTGIFCLVSLHDENFLRPFISSPLFNFHVVYTALPQGKAGCIAVCIRKSNQGLDEQAIGALEEAVMNNYFKEQCPLFSQEQIDTIIRKFNHSVEQGYDIEGEGFFEDQQQRLALPVAYNLLFGDRPELGYSYELFLEDIMNFQLVEEGSMNAKEAITFIKSME